MKKKSIKTPLIFSSKQCLKFLARYRNECLFKVEGNRLRKLFVFDKKPILIELYFENDQKLWIQFLNESPTQAQLSYIICYIKNWLDFDYDLLPFYEMAKKDNILKMHVENYFGLRMIGIPDFFEAICWAIIGQQINLSFAYAVKRNLVEKFGTKFQFKGANYYQFPTPETILSISDQAFVRLKFSRQKTAYLRAISKIMAEQSFDYQRFIKSGYLEAKSKLVKLHGIGNWSADYILMKTFKHREAFPIQDIGLQNALKKSLKQTQKPDLQTILKLSKPWKGYEAYATFYLWRSLYD